MATSVESVLTHTGTQTRLLRHRYVTHKHTQSHCTQLSDPHSHDTCQERGQFNCYALCMLGVQAPLVLKA